MPQSHCIGAPTAVRSSRSVARLFGDLKVRPKLMVLHNLFFGILVLGVYFALYPYLPDQGKMNLFIVLGSIYVLAVLALRNHHHAALRLPTAGGNY
ncbi:MAG TPA: hypothetical protein VEV17_22520 [Bryobacteraceae bacterium]|nr:hypothetical protein [Bryobacteraceae bacterium]